MKPKCSKCNSSENVVKNGFVRDQQRWRCKTCNYDFIPTKTLMTPKFEYYDLKMLAVFLLRAGVKSETIFQYVITLKNNNLKTHKVIYQWSKELSKQANNDFDFKIPARIESYNVTSFREFKSARDNFLKQFDEYSNSAYLIYLVINDTKKMSQILVFKKPKMSIFKDGIQVNLAEEISDKPIWFYFLLSFICKVNLDIRAKRIFISDDISLAENLFKNYENFLRYMYKNYFKNVTESDYSTIVNYVDENQTNSVENRTHCFIYFDSIFNEPNICLIKRRALANESGCKNSTSMNEYNYKK